MSRGCVIDRAKTPWFFGRWAVIGAALTCVLGLGACGPDEPEVTPTSSNAPSSVPSVTTPPVPVKSPEPLVPDAMADPGEAGAIAAAKYFLELYDYAFNTWDLTQWASIMDPECKFCQSVVDDVEEIQVAGVYVESTRTVIHDIAVEAPNAKHAHYLLTIKATQGLSRSYGRDREPIREAAAETQVIRLAVLRVDDSWILYEGGASAVE